MALARQVQLRDGSSHSSVSVKRRKPRSRFVNINQTTASFTPLPKVMNEMFGLDTFQPAKKLSPSKRPCDAPGYEYI